MDITPETVAVLWVGAGAVVLWMWLPAVLNALGLTLWQVSVDEDAAALEPSGSDPAYEELFAQLRCLGFVPVGRRSKTCWFMVHHWYRNFQARIFAAPQGDDQRRLSVPDQPSAPAATAARGPARNLPRKTRLCTRTGRKTPGRHATQRGVASSCIAVTYKLRPWDPWRLCFVTAFSDGAIVETANQMESLRIDEPDHLRWGLATPDRALLLERHREACRSFAAGGSRSVAVLPAEQVSRLELHHASRHHRKRHRWTGLKVMSNSLWCLGIGLLLVRRFGGTAPYLLPVSVIAWVFLWPAVHACLFRVAAGSFRAEDARRQRNQQTPRRLDGGAL